MQSSSVRTTTHIYPQEELNAMTNFYGGKRCVIQREMENVEWCHILDVALGSSNARLSEMLTRKLRQDRHPRHAAEVRENVVSLNVNIHRSMDAHPPGSTLFIHEDILARTLDYEQDLRDWRIAELNAGRSDPGRPEYEEVFGRLPPQVTQHRYHGGSIAFFVRNAGTDEVRVPELYSGEDCPGIDHRGSQKNFPIIDTLLSIPFSLLHTLPRLSGIVPISPFQQQLVTMGAEIVSLWWWDPPAELIAKSEEIRCRNIDANQLDDTRKPKPYPVYHPSRNTTTFETKKPCTTYGTPRTPSYGHSLNQDPHTIESASGQILLGGIPSLSRDKDGLLILGNDEIGEMEDVQHNDKGVFVGVTGSPMTSEVSDVQSPERIEGFDDVESIDEDIEEKPLVCLSSTDIMSWYEKVDDARVELLPLTSSPYERGVIGGSSTNDMLMIKGLIDPWVYIQFLDLSIIKLMDFS